MAKGRPPLKIDPEEVRALARIGCKKTEAARMLGISVDTLDRRFAEDFELGDAQGKTQLRRSQYKRATVAESDAMLIHLGMDRLGQKTKGEVTSEQHVSGRVVILPGNGRKSDPAPAGPADELPGDSG